MNFDSGFGKRLHSKSLKPVNGGTLVNVSLELVDDFQVPYQHPEFWVDLFLFSYASNSFALL